MEDFEEVLTPFIGVFYLARNLISGLIGLSYDARLILFLKKQNEAQKNTGQDKLVPWKAQYDEFDYNVPVAATLISLFAALSCMGILNTLFNGFGLAILILPNVPFIFSSILLPLLLGLTIRTRREQKPKPQIPQGPCFHDSDDTEMEDIPAEQDAEEQNVQEDVLEQNYDLEVANNVDHKVIFVQPMEDNIDEDLESEQYK